METPTPAAPLRDSKTSLVTLRGAGVGSWKRASRFREALFSSSTQDLGFAAFFRSAVTSDDNIVEHEAVAGYRTVGLEAEADLDVLAVEGGYVDLLGAPVTISGVGLEGGELRRSRLFTFGGSSIFRRRLGRSNDFSDLYVHFVVAILEAERAVEDQGATGEGAQVDFAAHQRSVGVVTVVAVGAIGEYLTATFDFYLTPGAFYAPVGTVVVEGVLESYGRSRNGGSGGADFGEVTDVVLNLQSEVELLLLSGEAHGNFEGLDVTGALRGHGGDGASGFPASFAFSGFTFNDGSVGYLQHVAVGIATPVVVTGSGPLEVNFSGLGVVHTEVVGSARSNVVLFEAVVDVQAATAEHSAVELRLLVHTVEQASS